MGSEYFVSIHALDGNATASNKKNIFDGIIFVLCMVFIFLLFIGASITERDHDDNRKNKQVENSHF